MSVRFVVSCVYDEEVQIYTDNLFFPACIGGAYGFDCGIAGIDA